MTVQEACNIIGQRLVGKEVNGNTITLVVVDKWDTERVAGLTDDKPLARLVIDGWHFRAHYINYDIPEEDDGVYLLSFYGELLGLKRKEDATPKMIKEWADTIFDD